MQIESSQLESCKLDFPNMRPSNLDPLIWNYPTFNLNSSNCDYLNSGYPIHIIKSFQLGSFISNYHILYIYIVINRFPIQIWSNTDYPNIYYYILLKYQLSEIYYDICMYIIRLVKHRFIVDLW